MPLHAKSSCVELENSLAQLGKQSAECEGDDQLRLDLEIHQVELEMQNRQPIADIEELEESRDAYAQLYDFAPVPCLTLDRTGIIRDLNLAAAELLGRPRQQVQNWRLSSFVTENDKLLLQNYLLRPPGQGAIPDHPVVGRQVGASRRPDSGHAGDSIRAPADSRRLYQAKDDEEVIPE